jgi:alkaline phosphatase D
VTAAASAGAACYGTPAGALPDAVSAGADSAMTYSSSTGLGYSWNLTTTAGFSGNCFAGWQTIIGSLATHWFRMDLFLTANPSAQHQLYAACESGSRVADISITAGGNILARNAAGTTILTTTSSVPLNTPFRIEGFITGDPAAGQLEVKLFPSRSATVPTETQTSGTALNTLGAPNQYRFGLGTGGVAGLSWDAGTCAISPSGYIGPGAIVQQMACGAPTASGFTVISKPVGGTSLRLKVATNSGLTQNVTYVAAQAPDAYGYTQHLVTGCQPYTRYWCQLLDTVDGAEVAVGFAGQCKTLPAAGQPAAFTVALVSCINTADETPSPNAAITDWIGWEPDLAVFTGDYSYENPVATDVPDQLGVYEYQTSWYGTEPLIRQAWGYYCRSNHDSYETGAQNTDDYQNTAVAANLAAAREAFPQGTLDTTYSPVHGLWQTWAAGRARFIMLDIRNLDRSPGGNTDNASKTMLGAVQLAWLEQQLIQPEPLKVIVTDTAWMGLLSNVSGDLEDAKWWSYSTERATLISYMAANAARVQNVMLWHGDTHAVACAPGGSNSWGGFPVYCAAPMRQTGAAVYNGSTFTQLYNNSGGECRQYGRITFTDDGDRITVSFQGWDAVNQVAQVTQTDTFTCPPAAQARGGMLTGLVA